MAYVFGVETGSDMRQVADVYAINHGVPIAHEYPRKFDFRQEFLANGGEPNVVLRCVRECLFEEHDDHVLYVFSRDVAEKIPAYQSLGYHHAWNNALLGMPLGEVVELPVAGLRVREIANTADVVTYQGLSGSAAVAHSTTDANVHTFLCEDDNGVPMGRGQLVTENKLFAYVSGMFTAPEHRRCGVGTALMNAMHQRGMKKGARFCLLVPSRFASEINFYPKFNYEVVAPHAVFIPSQ